MGRQSESCCSRQQFLLQSLCQPRGLRLLALPDLVTVIKAGGDLRQVGASQCLADVLKSSDYKYQLLFYATNALIPGHSSNVLIPTNGLSPFVSWTIENPDGAAGTNRLRVIEETGSLRLTNTYAWNGAGWEVEAGNGLRKQLLTSAWDQEHSIRTETSQTLEPGGGRLVAQMVSRHKLFDWGEGLVEEVIGSGKQARTNFSTY